MCVCVGMVNRIGCSDEETADSEALDRRLRSLSNFQAMLLRHALSFPSVQRVVYSTCSVYECENELVVQDVLQSSEHFRLVDILPTFSGRGKSSALPQASSCVRMSPETCLTIGFFVACLERVSEFPDQHHPSSLKSEFVDQKETDVIVLKSASREKQIESITEAERQKLHKHKKAKTARFEHSEVHDAVVKDRSNSGHDRDPQMSLSEKLLLSLPTTDTADTVGESQKPHKRKKSKKEKSAELDLTELDLTADLERSNCVHNAPDLHSSGDVLQTGGRKSHKHKKMKREKSTGIEQSETRTPELGRQSHTSLSETASSVLESVGSEMQAEADVMKEFRKSHKCKKLKKAKTVRFDHSEVDDAVVKDRSNSGHDRDPQKRFSEKLLLSPLTTGIGDAETVGEIQKPHKRKKSKKEKSAKLAKLKLTELDLTADLERSDCVHNSPDLHSSGDVMQTGGRKSHKHKKMKREKSTGIEQSETRTPELGRQSHTSLSESASSVLESVGSEMQAEADVMKGSRKSHKRKKSKKEKAAKFVEPERNVTGGDKMVLDRMELKKLRKHKKRRSE